MYEYFHYAFCFPLRASATMSSEAVRRILAEMREFTTINMRPDSFCVAYPLESDLFEWHFTVRGPPDTEFEGGVYHGRIVLPPEYPLKPPEIVLLTPNGRFEVNTRICLSVTSHHEETWQPSWGIRTILTALVGFMPTEAEGLGSLDYPPEERRRLAEKSRTWRCPQCGAYPIKQFAEKREEKDINPKVPPASSSRHAAIARARHARVADMERLGRESREERIAEGVREPLPENGLAVEEFVTALRSVRNASSEERVPRRRPVEQKGLLFVAYGLTVVIIALVWSRISFFLSDV